MVKAMLRLVFGVAVEVCVGVAVAGIILALVVPALQLADDGHRASAVTAIVAGVPAIVIAAALFRPGSAIRRYMKR